MQNVSEEQKGITHKILFYIKDIFYLYFKFALYAIVIYIIFYYYDYYFG